MKDDDLKLLKKEYNDILERILALKINSSTISRPSSRYDQAVESINSLVQIVDLHQFYKNFQINN